MTVSHLFEDIAEWIHVRCFDEILVALAMRHIVRAFFNLGEILRKEIDFSFVVVNEKSYHVMSADQPQKL